MHRDMEEPRGGVGSFALCLVAAVLGLLSSLSSIASELKRTKEEELKLDGKLCYLPGSDAYKYGVGALIFLCAGQIVGNSGLVWTCLCSRNKKAGRRRTKDDKKRLGIITSGLLVVSWVSFMLAVALLGAATSMNREQQYGKGWLDGECYIVKGGVYLGSAVLAIVAPCAVVCSAVFIKMRIEGQNHQEFPNNR